MPFLSLILPFLSTWKWWLIGGAFALLAAAWGVQTVRLSANKTELAVSRQAHAEYVAKSEAAARQLSEEYRIEDQRRASAIRSVVQNAIQITEAVAADAASARSASDRLRDRISALVAASRKASRDPAAPPGSASAPDALDLLADVQRRTEEAAGQFARIADERGTAGLTCERAYGALTK
jgi:hypothetical protein